MPSDFKSFRDTTETEYNSMLATIRLLRDEVKAAQNQGYPYNDIAYITSILWKLGEMAGSNISLSAAYARLAKHLEEKVARLTSND